MCNSNFDKNGLDKPGSHWLQYAAFVITSFAIDFGWAFFNDASFHHFAVKIFKFLNCNEYNPLIYCVMRWKVDFLSLKITSENKIIYSFNSDLKLCLAS